MKQNVHLLRRVIMKTALSTLKLAEPGDATAGRADAVIIGDVLVPIGSRGTKLMPLLKTGWVAVPVEFWEHDSWEEQTASVLLLNFVII